MLVFLLLGLVEEITVSHAGSLNERIVAVCAAGLVAGPWVGLAVSVVVTWLAVAHDGLPVRLHRNFHVVRRSGGRMALPVASQAGPTPANGVLSDFGGFVIQERVSLLLPSRFPCLVALAR